MKTSCEYHNLGDTDCCTKPCDFMLSFSCVGERERLIKGPNAFSHSVAVSMKLQYSLNWTNKMEKEILFPGRGLSLNFC